MAGKYYHGECEGCHWNGIDCTPDFYDDNTSEVYKCFKPFVPDVSYDEVFNGLVDIKDETSE